MLANLTIQQIPLMISASDREPPVLEVRNLTVSYPKRRTAFYRPRNPVSAVDDVSLHLSPGETLGIVGESGSGKSSLARAIVGLAPITSGAIRIGGKDVSNSRGAARSTTRRAAQMVFQDPYSSLYPRHDVQTILREPYLIHGLSGNLDAKVDELLEQVSLPRELKSHRPRELSGGQAQRVA